MEEIQNPIVHAPFTDPQLMNAIIEEVRQGPSQFVAERGEAFNRGHAGLIRLLIRFTKLAEPTEDRYLTFGLPVEEHAGARHWPTTQAYHNIVIQIAARRFGKGRASFGLDGTI